MKGKYSPAHAGFTDCPEKPTGSVIVVEAKPEGGYDEAIEIFMKG